MLLGLHDELTQNDAAYELLSLVAALNSYIKQQSAALDAHLQHDMFDRYSTWQIFLKCKAYISHVFLDFLNCAMTALSPLVSDRLFVSVSVVNCIGDRQFASVCVVY